MEHDVETRWYALFVVTGDEDKVKERIKFKFKSLLKVIVPKRKIKERKSGKWVEIQKNLFPGYVIINGNVDENDYYKLKFIPGVIRPLKSGSFLATIEENEIEVIAKLIKDSELIGFSEAIYVNGKVKVVSGPLVGMEGYIKSINKRKGRAKVALSFLGEQKTVDLGLNLITTVAE